MTPPSSPSRPKHEARELTDADLVRRVLDGHRDDYGLLVQRYLRLAQGKLARWGLRGAELDEAVQEAFVQAYVGLPRLRDAGRFGAYVLTIAGRVTRSSRRTVGLEGFDPQAPPEPDQSWRPALRSAMADLPEQMQVVLAMKYGEGLAAKQIAQRLGQSVGSVTKTLSRAYQRLRSDPRLADFASETPNE